MEGLVIVEGGGALVTDLRLDEDRVVKFVYTGYGSNLRANTADISTPGIPSVLAPAPADTDGGRGQRVGSDYLPR